MMTAAYMYRALLCTRGWASNIYNAIMKDMLASPPNDREDTDGLIWERMHGSGLQGEGQDVNALRTENSTRGPNP